MSETVLQEDWVSELFKKYPQKMFGPKAYYDQWRDAIYFEIRDCSITEHEIGGNSFILLEDNHPEHGQQKYIGFVIRDVKVLFATFRMPLKGGIRLLNILKEMLKIYPDIEVEAAVAQFIPFLRETELEIIIEENKE